MDVRKIGHVVPVSDELARDHAPLATALASSYRAWLDATPEQREEMQREHERWEAERKQERARERDSAGQVPLTVDGLLAKMGWTHAYAEHLVQPYCECGPNGVDGEWQRCAHAVDLGIEES
jgi:hypothetical protein